LTLDPQNLEALINLANVSELEGDYFSAVRQYKKAIEINPEAIAPSYCLAVLYERYDMFDEAVDEYEKVLVKNPLHTKAAFNLANICLQLGEFEKAAGLFERVLEIDPDNEDAWNGLGATYENLDSMTGRGILRRLDFM